MRTADGAWPAAVVPAAITPTPVSPTPGPLTAHRIALLPDGSAAEAVLDTSGRAWATWYDGISWSAWYLVAANAVDVSISAASVGGVGTADVSVTFGHPATPGRGIWSLTAAGGLQGTTL